MKHVVYKKKEALFWTPTEMLKWKNKKDWYISNLCLKTPMKHVHSLQEQLVPLTALFSLQHIPKSPLLHIKSVFYFPALQAQHREQAFSNFPFSILSSILEDYMSSSFIFPFVKLFKFVLIFLNVTLTKTHVLLLSPGFAYIYISLKCSHMRPHQQH